MNKVKTGIEGLDPLIGGGFPESSIVLLSGTPGTGKTIFGLQYLSVAKKGLYISFEEPKENLVEQAKQFGWDLKNVKIMYIPSKNITNATLTEIIETVKKNNYERLVIDSVSTLALSIPTIHNKVTEITKFSIKRFVHHFLEDLRQLKNTTTLLIGQTLDEKMLSNDEISEFMADGIIHIIYESLGGEFSRSLIVRKMRKVKNNEDIHPLEISKKGLIIHSVD